MESRKTRSGTVGTPDSRTYDLIFLIVRLWLGRRQPLEIDGAMLSEADAPYIMLVNHESFYDFYYVSSLPHPKRPSYLVNEYYCTRPILKQMALRGGILSKKLFTRDTSTAVGLLRTIRRGFPVVIFPEGRLSPDGRSNTIVEKGGALYKKLKVDLVLTRIEGAYFAAPKWRDRSYRSKVRITVRRVFKRDELQRMSADEIDALIASELYQDASDAAIDIYPQKNKARGLDTLLYRCADCGALYQTGSSGNTLFCRACGSRHTLDEHYRFTDAPGTIGAYYERIRQMEALEADGFSLSCEVDTLIHGASGGPNRRERGVCALTPEGFSYASGSVRFSVPIADLPALAFSCAKEFELYYRDELYYFYPRKQRKQVARWALLVDLLNEKRRAEQEPSGRR